MVKGKMLHFVAFFVHFDKLIRPHPGPLWGGVSVKTSASQPKQLFLTFPFPYIYD